MARYAHGDRSRTTIINTALLLWHEGGEKAVSARAIGARMQGMSHAGVLYHFGGIADLMREVKAEAIARRDSKIIPQLIVAGDPLVAHWTPAERQAWLAASG